LLSSHETPADVDVRQSNVEEHLSNIDQDEPSVPAGIIGFTE